MSYQPLPHGIRSATRFQAQEPKPGEDEYSGEKTRLLVTVAHEPIGYLVEGYWGYWHGELMDGTEVRGDFGYGNKFRPTASLWRRAFEDGLLPEIPEPRTAADWLREIAFSGQHGHSHNPGSFRMSSGYCSFYWSGHTQAMDHEMWEQVAEVSARLHRFRHYRDEVKPQWTAVQDVFYGDNSEAVIERDRHGNERERMTAGPSGDLCF